MKPWLLVEDEPDISEMLLAVFDLWGIESICHQDGEETQHWLAQVERGEITDLPELALIDIRLVGEVDGITVCQRIRKCEPLKDIIIVLNTAYSLTEGEKQQCLDISGADRVMSKPLPRFDRLYEELQQLVSEKRAQRSGYASESILGPAPDSTEDFVEITSWQDEREPERTERSSMRSFSPAGGYSRRARRRLQAAFLLVGAGTFLALTGLALSLVPLVGREGRFAEIYQTFAQLPIIAGALLALAGLLLAVMTYRRRTDDELALKVAQELRQQLDDRFTFISNINSRYLRGLDALIAGPPGLLALRILDLKGDLYQERGYWLRQGKRGDFLPLSTDPTRELLRDIRRLRERLARNQLADFPLFAIIVAVHGPPDLQYHAAGEIVPLAYLSSLQENLRGNYLARERVTMRALRATMQHLRISSEH